jgi:hypothetical protein
VTTRTRRPSAAALVLMVLCAWPALHVLAYVLGTTVHALLIAAMYGAGFTLGALVLLNLAFQLLRR